MRYILGLLILFFCLASFGKEERYMRRRAKGLDINDDKFSELPVQFFPKDGYIVDTFEILPIGSNGFYQIWDEVHLDETDGAVKLARSDASSNALWQTTVSDFKGVQRKPRLIDFSDGSLLCVWESSSAGTNNVNLWCMRFDSDGEKLWDIAAPVSCAPKNQRNVSLGHLKSGGIGAIWEDLRNGDSDIYFQEIMPDGSPLYTPDGVVIEKVEGEQLKPAFVCDEEGNALKITWEDHKDLSYAVCKVTLEIDDLSVPEPGISLIALLLLLLAKRKASL